MIALITAILGVAKPLLDAAYFNSVMQYLHEYEDTLKKIDQAYALWPDLDDALIGALKKEKRRLEGAIEKQAALITVKPA